MRFLPFETIVIETPLTKEDTISILASNVEREKTFRFLNRSVTKAFEGQLTGNEFEIKRIITYRNSFLPIVKGRIETLETGTRLTVKMRLHLAVMIFMTVWFGFVGLFLIVSLSSEDGSSTFLFPLGMLIFAYALTMGGYLFESYRTKKILTGLTKGYIISDDRCSVFPTRQKYHNKNMRSKTFNLFIISGLILLATILAAAFWDALGLGKNKIPLAMTTTIAFGLSIAGLVIGFGEIKASKTAKTWIALLGHFIVVGVFILSVVYALML